MSDSKYSVLFMRDDRNVTRYRVSPFWLKMFIFVQVFLGVCAAGGIYMGVHWFRINSTLEAEKKGLEQRLVAAEVRLERLGNMEKILESYDPAELQSLLTAATAEVEQQQEEVKIDLSKIFVRTDDRVVGVENLQADIANRKFSVSFELNNLQASRQTVVGQASLSLLRTDGTPVTIKYKASDLTFQIQRFKRMRTNFVLPDGLKQEDLFGLRLEIKGRNGDVFFAETYPLYNILA